MISKTVESRIKRLRYNKEYSYEIFSDLQNKEAVRKALHRMPEHVRFTSHGRFFRTSPKTPKTVIHNPEDYAFNRFWQKSTPSIQNVSSIIQNYLDSLNPSEIKTICQKFGYCTVKSELIAQYKELYKQGFVDIKGLRIELKGRWDRDPIYKKTLRILNDIKSN